MCYSASGILGRINGTVLELKLKIFHGETAGISSTPIASTKCESGEPSHNLFCGGVLRPDDAALQAVKNKHSAFIHCRVLIFFAPIALIINYEVRK